jgi:hypothetical protein
VLRGAIEFSTHSDGKAVREILLPGDACFFDSSVPHALAETRYTPYEPPGAEMLVVRCDPAAAAAASPAARRAARDLGPQVVAHVPRRASTR